MGSNRSANLNHRPDRKLSTHDNASVTSHAIVLDLCGSPAYDHVILKRPPSIGASKLVSHSQTTISGTDDSRSTSIVSKQCASLVKHRLVLSAKQCANLRSTMLDNNGLIATAVDPSEIAQLADEDLALAIVAEKKLMEGMAKLDARAWIDKKTRILQQSMMALKTIRNNLADVDNLPDEILVEIFRQLAFVDRPFFAVDPIEKKSLKVRTSWLAVARVCRRWRNIALDTPKLYSIIDARNTAITRMFLKRSRNIPVDIYMQSISLSTNVDGIMTEIMPHFSRVREFQFRARYQSMLALMSHIESLAAPML